jgi:DNA helicase-2/ATP-dependent DNA helicase PcrA
MNLNPNQKLAAETLDQNLQIIACAGSGKTQVVSQRIVNLLKDGKDPSSIVAFTYTDKAAAELKHRVLELVQTYPILQNIGMSELYIGTIHSWCWYILQDTVYGLQKINILDEIKLQLFIDRAYIKMGMKELGMKQYKDTKLFVSLIGVIREAELKDGCQFPENLKGAKNKFEEYLLDHDYFDFTMIMTKFLEEINNPSSALSERIKSNLKYLIVDEYQDINYVQECIIEAIAREGANLCVVGDDDQTIFQWRGSNIKNILNFKNKYENVRTVTLDDNYRSSKAIISVATNIIKTIPADNRLQKEMKSKDYQDYEQADLVKNVFLTIEEEVDYITNTIKNVRGIAFKDGPDSQKRGLDYSDMCILVRKWQVADIYADGLQNAGIPYVVTGVNRLFKQRETIACHNIFRYLNKEISADDLKESWFIIAPKLKKDNIDEAKKYLDSLFKYLEGKKVWYEYFILQDIFKQFRERLELTEGLFSGESNELGMVRGEIAFYNMGMFSQIIQDFETIHFKDHPSSKLYGFLSFLKYSAEDYYPEGWLNNSLSTPNAVTITTIHKSKGLEFPIVFIPGMNKNYFPAKKLGGKNIWSFIDKGLIEDQERYEGSLEDECRLFYVAVTRAKKFLFITRAPRPTGNHLYDNESEFYNLLRKLPEYIFQSDNNYSERFRLLPERLNKANSIVLNFSILESYFECPYKFKYYVVYGFKEPLSGRIGYGKSIHDSLMEIHKRSKDGDVPEIGEIGDILAKHKSFPYALEATSTELEKKAKSALISYYNDNKNDFKNITYVEKNIELDFGDGVFVNGRIDLIKKKELDGQDKIYIVDFKSTVDVNREKIIFKQLQLYSLGYQRLTGEKADFLQIYNFDKFTSETKELTDNDMSNIRGEIKSAAEKIIEGSLNHKCGNKDCPCRFNKTG